MKFTPAARRAEIDTGALSPQAWKRLAELQANRLDDPRNAALWQAALDLNTFVGLMNAAALQDSGSARALQSMVIETLAGAFSRFSLGGVGGKPPGRGADGPCGAVVMPDPMRILAAGIAIDAIAGMPPPLPGKNNVDDRTPPSWSVGVLQAWALRASPLEMALQGGADGRFPPREPVMPPCISAYQVCVSELLFTAIPLLGVLGGNPFPAIGAVTPAEQCTAAAPTPLTLTPPTGESFPPQTSVGGAYLLIDNQPATVLSWNSSAIVIAHPPGISPGCHDIGWAQVTDPAALQQIRDIGQFCLPWIRTSFPTLPLLRRNIAASFGIIGTPFIRRFNGPNASTVFQAEACMPITLRWTVEPQASCPGSASQVQVSLWRDGQIVAAGLPLSGELDVSDDSRRTFTLRAQAVLGNASCGHAEQTVTIDRERRIYARPIGPGGSTLGPDNIGCIAPGEPVRVIVVVSCPALAGGLPVVIEGVLPANLPSSNFTLDEGEQTAEFEMSAPSACAPVTMRVTAPNHRPAEIRFTVMSRPVITSVSPTVFDSCELPACVIDGQCIGANANAVAVVLQGPNGPVEGNVQVVVPNFRLRVGFAALPAGSYNLVLTTCAGQTAASSPLEVLLPTPSIVSALQCTNATVVALCTVPQLSFSFSTRRAVLVTVSRGSTKVFERRYTTPCVAHQEIFSDRTPLIESALQYTLTATGEDGTQVTSALQLPLVLPAISVGSAMVAVNNYTAPICVFIFEDETGNGSFVGELAPNGTKTITLPKCRIRHLVSLDPALVLDHNRRLGDTLDPKAPSTAATTSGIWIRTTASALGFTNAPTFQVNV